MDFKDLREFIKVVEEKGELKKLDGADPHLEIGAITELATFTDNCPAVLFDSIKGYPKGSRILTNFITNRFRERLIHGVSMELSDREAVRYWKERMKQFEPLPPVEVKSGPVTENVLLDKDVDLLKLPWPQWHERDGGKYMCATSVVTRDPDSGYLNVGSYRFMLVNQNTIVAHIGSGHDGDVIRKKYWAMGKPCPAAISLGQEPALLVAAGTILPWGISEYDFAGWLRQSPVEVTRGVYTDLPVPATAEVVFEGDMLPPEEAMEIEGPFGEFSGYYGGNARPAPAMKIRSMLFRSNPVTLGAPPFLGASRGTLSSRAIIVWNELEALGIPNIMGVSKNYGVTVISIKQAYPGHVMRAAHGALGGTAAYHGRFVIVVDDDIDPYNWEDVMWALATRCDPETSIDICRKIWSIRIDPRLAKDKKEAGDYTSSIAIIDACKPYHWMNDYPPTTKISEELLKKTDEKWGRLLRG